MDVLCKHPELTCLSTAISAVTTGSELADLQAPCWGPCWEVDCTGATMLEEQCKRIKED